MCYNTFVNSARFFRTQRTMRSRHALLLTPLESALASRSQLTENTATLSLSESALTKNAGVGGCTSDFWNSPLAAHRSPPYSSSFFSHSCALFCIHQKRNSFIFKLFRTFCPKHRVLGYPLCETMKKCRTR